MSLTQLEYKFLMGLEKEFEEKNELFLDGSWSRSIVSEKAREAFMLHYNLGTIRLDKFSYHKTYRKSIPLLRFCSSVRHTNPDGTVFEGAHVHIYQESLGDKIAFPVDEIGLSESNLSKDEVLKQFLIYCNIINTPQIVGTLF